ncbi:MAG TPA: RecQ family ATP-dependent DNA helicase [Verrucomicrobiales bacterium]|nr:RecQ family ATP-dependent DNA helicase [Verrucomicrobiales bacterium]
MSSSAPTTHDALAALEQYFGHRKFLEGQEQIIAAVLGGRDTLAIMPTGGGKSLCYQLPALIMDGVTVVISPLIALMKDQVDALERRGIAATLINSTLSPGEQQARIEALREGKYRLVYVAPERFRQRAFTDALRAADIALLAVDEAHCISQWGHDFRPDYMRLGESLERLGRPQVVALTATATPEVRADITRQLALRDPFQCVSGFARPNLSLNVTSCARKQDKFDRLRAVVNEYRTGIVYCATRAKVEDVTAELKSWRVNAIAYHGGMQEHERTSVQEEFISKRAAIAVATNAFGMGIDRPDVRFVVHFEIPGSLEAYYQEAGRAGRDGEPGWCELLFNYADTRTQEFFIEGSNPGYETICDIYQTLLNRRDAANRVLCSIEQLAEYAAVKNDMAVSSALSVLGRQRYIRRFDVPGKRIRGTEILQPQVGADQLDLDRAALEEKERRDWDKLKRITEWAYAATCRQSGILTYFGEQNAGDCGNCDYCRRQSERRGARLLTDLEMQTVRKALSGVARCCYRNGSKWEGRYGRARIAGMLTGSRSKEILSARLDELSTYGLLKEEGAAFVQSLLRELEAAGLLALSGGDYPLLSLTERGAAIMKSGGSLQLNMPAATSMVHPRGNAKTEPDVELTEVGFDEALYKKLRELRSTLADRDSVPSYVVFSNQTLEFLTRLRPTTAAAALRIRGIGERKAERYLEPFLEVIRKHRH